jgi:hypothetical protein
MRLAVHFHNNRVVHHGLQYPNEPPAALYRQLQLDKDSFSGESFEVRARAQNPIKTR